MFFYLGQTANQKKPGISPKKEQNIEQNVENFNKKAEQHFQKSLMFTHISEKKKALEEINKACNLNNSPKYLLQKAHILYLDKNKGKNKGKNKNKDKNKGKDKNEAIAIVKENFAKLPHKDDAFTYYIRGFVHHHGLLKKNLAKAIKFYKKAAKLKSVNAIAALGNIARRKKQPMKAEEYYKQAALLGHLNSALILARKYPKKYKDHKKVTKWRIVAADLGHAKSAYDLARLYHKRYNDYKKAEKWYLRAIELGHDRASRYIAGRYFWGGYGIKKDLNKSALYFEKAAKKGYHGGMAHLGIIYYILKKYDKSYKWYIKAAALENHTAMKGLGTYYYEGKAVKRDLEKTKYWWQEAVKHGNVNAAKYLKQVFGNATIFRKRF